MKRLRQRGVKGNEVEDVHVTICQYENLNKYLQIVIECKLMYFFVIFTSVFFNLFEAAEPKMTSKNFAEPKLPSKKLCGMPTFLS
jgi:hypothetical protein